MKKRRVVILGSTGSIGESALKVARDIPERMEVVGLAAGKNSARLIEQAREFSPKAVSVSDASAVKDVASATGLPTFSGDDGLCELATLPEADMVLISIVGTAGLRPALAAIVGDLAESLLKRSCGAKDSGRFLPGIGGALDLIDSILFTAPMMFFYLRFAVR